MKKKISNKEKVQKGALKKYRALILSIVTFLLLFVGVLGLNYFQSFQVSQSAREIAIAGRQGDLIQQITKNLIDISLLAERMETKDGKLDIDKLKEQVFKQYNQLIIAKRLFNDSLEAFSNGGMTIDTSQQKVVVNKVEIPAAVRNVNNATTIWKPFLGLIDNFIQGYEENTVELDTINFASDYSRIYNIELLDDMNDLSAVLQVDAQKRAELIKLIQIGGIVLALAIFAFIVIRVLGSLFKTDRELEEARNETTEILETVNEGLFLLDETLTIGTQYSTQLEVILGKKNIANRKLGALLQEVISRKDYETTEEFIEQLFNPHVIEELIYDLNPLDRVRAVISDEKGVQSSRYLSFNFSRAYSGSTITHVLVSISDITKAVALEEQLEREREQSNEQLEMLASILQVEQTQMATFIKRVYAVCDKTNTALKRPDKDLSTLKAKLDTVFREAHSIKGEASALGLNSFTTIANDIETQVSDLKTKVNLQGNDFLPVTVLLNKLIALNERVDSLFQKIGGANVLSSDSGVSQKAQQAPSSLMTNEFFANFAGEVGKRNNKLVKASVVGFDSVKDISEEKQIVIKDITIQLLRNAVVHGIETPEERINSNKDQVGNLTLALTSVDNHHHMLVVEDDGKGIDFDTLQAKAEKAGVFAGQSEPPTKRQLLAFMFTAGVSTKEEHNEDAGRGVGMDIIKERVRDLSGKISINSKKGLFTRFKVHFPN